MKKYMFFALMTAIILSACSSDDIFSDKENQDVTPEIATVPLNVTAISSDNSELAAKANVSSKHRVIGTSTSSGVSLEWETTDAITVLCGEDLAKTDLPLTTKESTTRAFFSGDIATGGQTVVETTPLYSYIASSDITFNSETKNVTIDLTDQDGSLNDAIKHSLLLGQTTYGNGNATFNYSNQLAIMELKFRGIGTNESGVASVEFYAEQGIPSSVTCNLTTGAITSTDGNSAKATNVTVLNGEATCYLAIAPNTNQTINNTVVKININGHYYAHTMSVTEIPVGSIEANNIYEQRIKNPKVPVGSWLFSDGTWGEKNVAQPTKTIVGIIYSNEPDAADAALGYTHGYAIALEDLPEPRWWSGYLLQHGYDYLGVKRNATQEAALEALLGEPSGIGYTQILVTNTGYTARAAEQAHLYAGNHSYSNSITSFLPTAGHMLRMLFNLGGLPFTAPNEVNGQGLSSEAEEFKWTGTDVASNVYTNLAASGVLNIDQGMTANTAGGQLNGNILADRQYWTSTQCDGNESYCFILSIVNKWLFFDAEVVDNLKYIRPFLAF